MPKSIIGNFQSIIDLGLVTVDKINDVGVAWMCEHLVQPTICSLQSYSYARLEQELHKLICVRTIASVYMRTPCKQ